MSQGNVPGVESASLAMDTEEGVEVVWNEVLFSDKKVFKAQEVVWLWFLTAMTGGFIVCLFWDAVEDFTQVWRNSRTSL